MIVDIRKSKEITSTCENAKIVSIILNTLVKCNCSFCHIDKCRVCMQVKKIIKVKLNMSKNNIQISWVLPNVWGNKKKKKGFETLIIFKRVDLRRKRNNFGWMSSGNYVIILSYYSVISLVILWISNSYRKSYNVYSL